MTHRFEVAAVRRLMDALKYRSAYRNAGARVFHVMSADWIRSGLGECGVDISRPVLAIDHPTPLSKLCATCVRKLVRP